MTSSIIKLGNHSAQSRKSMQCKNDNVQNCAGVSRYFTLSPEQEIRLRLDRGLLHFYLQVLLNKRLEENCGEEEKSLKPFAELL